MLNLPALLEHPVSPEIAIGLVYGCALAATVAKPRRCRSATWCLLIIAATYGTFAACQSWASQWTLSRTWTLAGLVCVSSAVESFRLRIVNFDTASRQYALSDLMVLTTGLACFIAGIRQTSLSAQGSVFWAGMAVIGAVLPCCVVFLRIRRSWGSFFSVIGSFTAAVLVAVGLAWTESTILQSQRITIGEAAMRYGSLITAMLMPRLLFQIIQHAWAALPTNYEHHDTPAMPSDESPATGSTAAEQTQPALKLLT